MTTKECEQCGNDYDAKRPDTKYCSPQCKREAFYHNKAKKIHESMGVVTPPPGLPASPGLDLGPQFNFVISELTRTRDNLERDLTKERESLQAIVLKHQQLEKEYAEYKNEQRFLEIQNNKPDKLSGFLESETGKKITDVLIPAIAAKMLGPAGGLNGPVEERTLHLSNWFENLDPNGKDLFWQMILPISNMPPEEAAKLIARVIHLMNTGTTVSGPAPQHQQQPTGPKMGYG